MSDTLLADLLDGATAKTGDTWLGGLKRYSAWLADEGEIPIDPLLRMPAPKLDQQVVTPLTEDDLKALLGTCKGKTLRDRRDEAILRMMMETGLRANEVVGACIWRHDDRTAVLCVDGPYGQGITFPIDDCADLAAFLTNKPRIERHAVSPAKARVRRVDG